ncbi:hypothetical protein Droror1_Dr00008347 [Drosera rotundifolia]
MGRKLQQRRTRGYRVDLMERKTTGRGYLCRSRGEEDSWILVGIGEDEGCGEEMTVEAMTVEGDSPWRGIGDAAIEIATLERENEEIACFFFSFRE